MSNYIENYKSQIDWANVFVRTGDFPLDRSSIFSSYDDAVLYASGDGSDERGLGKTSYIGQILTVYENDVVTVYVINKDRGLDAVGSGSGSITIDNFTIVDDKVIEATENNIGQIIYITVGTDDYPEGPYIVTGDGSVAKLGITSNSGDLSGEVATLKSKVTSLQTKANANETAINNINNTIANIPTYNVEKAETADEGYASTYKFYKMVGEEKTELSSINIPLDQVLKNSYIKVVETADEPYEGAAVGDKYFEFLFQNNDTPLYLSANSLLTIYKGDNKYITIDDSNKIILNIDEVKDEVESVIDDKLNGITTDAQENIIEGITINGTKIDPDENKIVNITYTENLSEDEENAIKSKTVYSKFKTIDNDIENKLEFSFVESLPSTDIKNNVIYVVKITSDNISYYDLNIYYNNEWTLIGSTNFATKSLASSDNDGLMSKEHYDKLENLTPITSAELDDVFNNGIIVE